MSGFRMRAVMLFLGLVGTAFLVVAVFLWSVSQLQGDGLESFNPALFVVPGVLGAILCAGALVLLLLARGRRHLRSIDGFISRSATSPSVGAPDAGDMTERTDA